MKDTERVNAEIRAHKIIAILRNMPRDKLLCAADALYEGGIRAIECTFDHSRPGCTEAGAEAIGALATHMNGRMAIGAGTVLTVNEARAAAEAGARMIISPNVNAAVIAEARALGAIAIPGAMTPTEVAAAWEAGAHYVKLFPAGCLGIEYIRAIRAPLGHIPLLAVGGVEPEHMRAYLGAGVSGFGIGSPLLPKDAIERGNFGEITRRARAFVEAIT
jgi:2-dehydro-3-deoxyphosphogluconate aldolase/(4S)-4-hydroxy-2-oxoglutarate aldolase